MKHWAWKYIGRPWQKGGCWLLLQEVFQERHGVAMPEVRLGDLGDVENTSALKRAAEISGWKRCKGPPQADDILQMLDDEDRRHVGYVIQTKQGLRLLHSRGHMTEKGPVGGVVADPLADIPGLGFKHQECWRRSK